ncbi:LOW QUALITY PROTEIN: hypothetical protein ACHAW5_008322 [Stephanodiscus triporus]|uniref:Nicotinate-nucleotide--dimethylbenzimidazole phosphoribosyltransferase n=1 Tax=Stephanodiscus triporus TaxID=2934178 RepID=A0ABD3NXP4_9STRA
MTPSNGNDNNDDEHPEGRSASSSLARLQLSKTLIDPTNDFSTRYDAVRCYLDVLAKPVGSLGSLEDHAARMSALRRSLAPRVDVAICLIFAGDHGVAGDASEGGANCSSYPQSVTGMVLRGIDEGVAGCSVLARANGAMLRVVDVGVVAAAAAAADPPPTATNAREEVEGGDGRGRRRRQRLRPDHGPVVRRPSRGEAGVDGGTKNFCVDDAMTESEVERCVSIGKEETGKFIDEANADIVVFGEVGIGNTTSSSALIVALCGTTMDDVRSLCGIGASTTRDGIDSGGKVVSRKVAIIEEAMRYRRDESTLKGEPLMALSAVGGAEIAALVGGMIEASDRDVPVLVDGFIVTTAAMIACMIDPSVTRVLLFATKSTEVGQSVALDVINGIATSNGIPPPVAPALDMRLRMGEATGALLALPLVRSACAIVAELATLDEVLGLASNLPSAKNMDAIQATTVAGTNPTMENAADVATGSAGLGPVWSSGVVVAMGSHLASAGTHAA